MNPLFYIGLIAAACIAFIFGCSMIADAICRFAKAIEGKPPIEINVIGPAKVTQGHN